VEAQRAACLAVVRRRQELVTEKEADAWFGVTPDAVAAPKKQREAERAAKVVVLPKVVAACGLRFGAPEGKMRVILGAKGGH